MTVYAVVLDLVQRSSLYETEVQAAVRVGVVVQAAVRVGVVTNASDVPVAPPVEPVVFQLSAAPQSMGLVWDLFWDLIWDWFWDLGPIGYFQRDRQMGSEPALPLPMTPNLDPVQLVTRIVSKKLAAILAALSALAAPPD